MSAGERNGVDLKHAVKTHAKNTEIEISTSRLFFIALR
jgi:hypothetical protein